MGLRQLCIYVEISIWSILKFLQRERESAIVRDGVKNEKSTRESVIQGYYGGGPPISYLLRSQMIFEYRPIFGCMKFDVVLIPDETLLKCKM